jgi:L-seryl-tRNA(Ser) seleniumtransferase
MLTAPVGEIEARAEAVGAKLRAAGIEARVAESSASVGGGAFPTAAIASRAIVLSASVQDLEERLRLGEPAVIGRIFEGNLLLDLRSVLPREDDILAEAILKRHD